MWGHLFFSVGTNSLNWKNLKVWGFVFKIDSYLFAFDNYFASFFVILQHEIKAHAKDST